MAKQSEITAEVAALTAQLAASTATQNATNEKIDKIGKETDGLKQVIQDLQDALNNQDNASQELVDAVKAATDQYNLLAASVDAAGAKAQVVDDKVADAPPTPPT